MCGRYSLAVSPEELEVAFEAPVVTPLHLPRWNVAPTQEAPMVVAGRSGRRIGAARWGNGRGRGSSPGAPATFVIVTTTPDDVVAPLHERMPLILPPRAWATWLDREAPLSAVHAVLRPARGAGTGVGSGASLLARPVATLVNRPENDDARCVAPSPSEPLQKR